MIRNLTFILSWAMLATLVAEANASHPFHVTRAEIEFNSKRKTLEVALCVWPEDMMKALSKMEKQSIDIDALSDSKRDELLHKYVAQQFRFLPKSNSKSADKRQEQKPQRLTPAKIRWVGSEIGIKQGWLYFEVDASAKSDRWTIENEMFFEFNDDQMNHLEIRNGRKWSSQTIRATSPSVEWRR